MRATSDDLQHAGSDERELQALRDKVRELERRLEAVGAERRRELDALRESFHGELARKSVRVYELEQEKTEVTASYAGTFSWRITRPLRALKRLARSLRRT